MPSVIQPTVVRVEAPRATVVRVGTPGLQGPPGPMGPAGDAGGAFLVTNRLSEISSDEVAKAAARANIGLAVVDGGTFF